MKTEIQRLIKYSGIYSPHISEQVYTPYREIPQNQEEFHESHEVVEESLSLAQREKEFIIKALEKHRGRRKNAAQELGISERTLYRKIKEYHIQ